MSTPLLQSGPLPFPDDGSRWPLHAGEHGHEVGDIAAGHADLLLFVIIGVLAGAHCLGMCGPLVTAYADRFGNRRYSSTRRDESGSDQSPIPNGGSARDSADAIGAAGDSEPGGPGDRAMGDSDGPAMGDSDGPAMGDSGGRAMGESTDHAATAASLDPGGADATPKGPSHPNTRGRDVLTVYEVRQHVLFNLGRTVSYAAIGALLAAIGALAFASSDAVVSWGDAVRGAVGILVGLAIVLAGIHYLRGRPGLPHGLPVIGSLVGRLVAVLSRRIDRLATSPAIFGLGALHGLLPCPIIYPAYLYAFALADPLRGGLSLAALGLGTIPTLFAYGTLYGTFSRRTRVRLHRALGVAFVVLGYVALQHGLMLYGIHLPHPPIPYYQPL